MVQRLLKSTCTLGEISPLAHARQDAEFYAKGLATLENFMVLKEGGVRKRSGTQQLGKTKTNTVRFVDFVYATGDAYALEFGNNYVRFWTENGLVMDGSVPYEIVSPFTSAHLPELQWDQTGDEIYFGSPDRTIANRKLIRRGPLDWVFEIVTWRDGPYLPINDRSNPVTFTSGTPPVVGGTMRLTWANTLGINDDGGFAATDVWRTVRFQVNGGWNVARVSAVVSTTVIDVVVLEVAPVETVGTTTTTTTTDGAGTSISTKTETTTTDTTTFAPSLSWRLGAIGVTTGYPKCVALFNGRLCWANTKASPRGVFMSKAGVLDHYSPSTLKDGTVNDDHGIVVEIRAGRADDIVWIAEGQRLHVGMSGSIRSIGVADSNAVFGPRNIAHRREIRHGVGNVRPVAVGPSVVHAGRARDGIFDLVFDVDAGTMVSPEISVTADHMLKGRVKEIHTGEEPSQVLWTVTDTGDLVRTTLERYERVTGFARYPLPRGKVRSAAILPTFTDDRLLLMVERTINGTVVTYVEALLPEFDGADKKDGVFVDCSATYTGPATSTITGADWLEGETVAVLANGAVRPRVVVVDGVINVGKAATPITFGIPFSAKLKTLRAPVAGSEGSTMGRKTRVVAVDVDVYETLGLSMGAAGGIKDTISFRSANNAMDQSPPLKTGFVRIQADLGRDSNGQIEIASDDPLPATIRAVNITLDLEP